MQRRAHGDAAQTLLTSIRDCRANVRNDAQPLVVGVCRNRSGAVAMRNLFARSFPRDTLTIEYIASDHVYALVHKKYSACEFQRIDARHTSAKDT